ncbi:MAG: iron donor protein CyaY [Bryobacteraceae bacterium]
MDDQQFRDLADGALQDLQHRLVSASDQYTFDADFNNGALTIEFEDAPARFVVSPNSPVRQIWVSAHMKSHKLDWDPAKNAFAANGQTLVELIAEAISKQLDEEVTL